MKQIVISPKQREMMKVLEDNEHTEIFMGGAAGGSKSFTGCLWQILRRLMYPGSRGFLARARLKSLKESTLLTFFEVCNLLELKKGEDYIYNPIVGLIKFSNGSEEYLRDLFLYPSDAEFVSLGSTEYTDGYIDEMAEITEQAYQIIRSRMRFKLNEFGLIPKIAMGSNPCKTFIYREFYKKWRDNELEHFKAYIPASVYDNPFISPHYIENLKKLDPKNRERLLEGNWEYDNDPSKLFEFDKINDIFTNTPNRMKETPYISADIARFGNDYLVVIVWRGLHIEKIYTKHKSTTKEARELIQYLAQMWAVPRSNIVIDEDGVGGGVVDELKGVVGFVNNSRPYETDNVSKFNLLKHNYSNLKTQCYFKLADYINNGMISCEELELDVKNMLVEDLEQIKVKDPDKDGKIQLIGKDKIKENTGRSSDFSDALMMRMIFEIKPTYKPYISLK